MITLTPQQLNAICESYKNGESVLALSKKYKCSPHTIKNRLDKMSAGKVSQAKRLNPTFVEDYFENIDSKEKAYWIGWLLTDGGISSDNNNIQMSLQKQDEYILRLLESDLCISNHISPHHEDYVRFSLGSKKMVKDLSQYGIIPNKTLTLKFPSNISSEFDSSLLRGMFEGDGGLTVGIATRFYKHRNKSYTRPYQELSFTGTYDMCEGFQNMLLKHIEIPRKNVKHNHSIYRVRWSNKEEIIKILDFLYADCEKHCLTRKYNLYQRLKYTKEETA